MRSAALFRAVEQRTSGARELGEVWKAPPPRIRVINRYLEVTSLLSVLVNEEGALTPREVARRLKSRR